MSKRLTYREQLDKARQQAVVAGLREAARLAAEGALEAAYHLVDEAFAELARIVATEQPIEPAAAKEAADG